MIRFRPNKSTWKESLENAVDFETEEEMKLWIVKHHCNLFDITDIVIDDFKCQDNRTGWVDSRNVLIKRFGDIDYLVKYNSPQYIGTCATEWI